MYNTYVNCECGNRISWWGNGSAQIILCHTCGLAYVTYSDDPDKFSPADKVKSTELRFLDDQGKPCHSVPARAKVTIFQSLGMNENEISRILSPADIAELAVWAALQLPSR